METVIERDVIEDIERQVPCDGLFQVWFDVNCGTTSSPDWWWNSDPQALAGALREADVCRKQGFPAKLMPEGVNPRPDGRWDNPV